MQYDQWERTKTVTENIAAAPIDLSVLHRLRTDVGPDGRLPDAPPVPAVYRTPGEGISLRVADPSEDSQDPGKVADWMGRPHLVETWEQDWSAQTWAADWRAKLSTTYSLPLILGYGEDEVGYMEIYRPHRDEIGLVYGSEPHDLGFHVAVGEESLTGRGIFSPFLGDMARNLLEADPDCHLVLVEPSSTNHRVHRVLRRGGGVDAGERQQRADRRVRLFYWADGTVDPADRLLSAPVDD